MLKQIRLASAAGLTIAFWLLVTLSGCAGLGKSFAPPGVKLAGLRLKAFNGLETVFEVQLRVFNGNDAAFMVKGVECELELNGRSFATGVSDAKTEIAAYGTGVIPITVYSSVLDMVNTARGLSQNDRLQYRIKGKLHLGGDAFLPPVLPFKSEGTLSARGLSRLRK